MNSSLRVFIASVVLVFCGAMIYELTWYAQSHNSVQASALTGFFWTAWLILAGMGLGSISQHIPALLSAMTGKTPEQPSGGM